MSQRKPFPRRESGAGKLRREELSNEFRNAARQLRKYVLHEENLYESVRLEVSWFTFLVFSFINSEYDLSAVF